MKFSVIIPSFNRGHLISRALDSLTLQTYKKFEVIVVDDGSSDETKLVVEGYQNKLNLKYKKRDTPSGRAALPRNEAVDMSTGEWICFLDSDDWWYPEKLKRLVEYCQFYDVIYHDLDTFSAIGKACKKTKARKLKFPVFHDLMINHNGLVTSGVAMKKSIFIMVNGFREIDLEDYDLWLRVAKKTDKFFHLKETLGAYWLGDDNTTQVSMKEIERIERIFNEHVPYLSTENKKEALAALNFIKARIYHKMGQKNQASDYYKNAILAGNNRIRFLGICRFLQLTVSA